MTLCIDAGNSRVKIARVRDGRVGRVVTVASTAPRADIARAVRRAARGTNTCAISSVVPGLNRTLVAAAAAAHDAGPLLVTWRTPMPLRVAVERPAMLGTDRLCNAVGALGARRRSVIVVAVGTAVTVDLVRDRVFRGGVILPAPALSLLAMHEHTARLPRVDFAGGPEPRIDRTDRAMRWGAALAAAGGIRSAVEMLEDRAGRRLPVLVTGGGAAWLRRWLPRRCVFRDHLVLVGLDRIANLSESRQSRQNARP